MSVELVHGDAREVLARIDDCSVDAVVCDPPYEISFMSRGWDATGIAYDVSLWGEVLRVLKPGGHLLAFGGTRTYHRMAVAIEDAGFEVRDSLHWVYGSGFPKSLDVSKAIDKAAGAERAVVETIPDRWAGKGQVLQRATQQEKAEAHITAPATDAARQWEGWGTALKPAHEPIVVARKPLVGTVAATVLEHGTGALNIDGCRVGMSGATKRDGKGNAPNDTGWENMRGHGIAEVNAGRWPANLVFTHAADCQQVGATSDTFGGGAKATSGFVDGYEHDGFVSQTVEVPVWRCADGCPVAELDRQSGVSKSPAKVTRGGEMFGGGGRSRPMESVPCHNDTGGASRFFTVTEWDPTADVAPFRYVAKPSKKERNAGLDGLPERETMRYGEQGQGPERQQTPLKPVAQANTHPTVKPVALMRWLVRLVTPPGGTVLDPFAGSGTTLVAAVLEGFDAIGIELTDDYLPIIEGRVAWAETETANTTPTLFDEAQP